MLCGALMTQKQDDAPVHDTMGCQKHDWGSHKRTCSGFPSGPSTLFPFTVMPARTGCNKAWPCKQISSLSAANMLRLRSLCSQQSTRHRATTRSISITAWLESHTLWLLGLRGCNARTFRSRLLGRTEDFVCWLCWLHTDWP